MKHYLRTFKPGSFVSETSDREVSSRDVMPSISGRTYAYQFYDRESTVQNGEELLGKAKNFSPTYYFGRELTAEQAMAEANEIGRSNIKGNGYKRLVVTKFGQMLPLNDEDVVIS